MSGKKNASQSSLEAENKRLQKKVGKLELQLQKAEAMLDLQKKTSSLISLMIENSENDSNSSK